MLYKTRAPGPGNVGRLLLQMQQRRSYLIAQHCSYSVSRSSLVRASIPGCRAAKQASPGSPSTNGALKQSPYITSRYFVTSSCRCQNQGTDNTKGRNENTEKTSASNMPGAKPGSPPATGEAITNQQQRKADWAIMKEMPKYLWPKVRGSTRCPLHP